MNAHTGSTRRSLIALSLLASLPLLAVAGKPTASSIVPLTATVYSSVVDEQHGTGCPFPPFTDAAGMLPDAVPGATSAWNFFNWNNTTGLSSGVYDNGSYPVSAGSYLRAEFSTSDKNFTLDTRTTKNPLRTFTLDFTDPYNPDPNTPSFGSTLTTAGLFEVLGSAAMTSMGVCSSNTCPESRNIQAKLWFNDPVAADVQWRINWAFVRVLRVSSSTWYFIADACDGSQVGGLSKLQGNRTKPRETNQGYYLIPLFIAAERK